MIYKQKTPIKYKTLIIKMKNKRGTELLVWSMGVAVLITVAIVIVIAFYDLETGKFSTFIRKISGKSNTEELTNHCNNLIERNARYEYCCARKQAIYETQDQIKKQEITCQELSTKGIIKTNQLNCENIC